MSSTVKVFIIMCLIGTTICSNLVFTMGLTRRDSNRLYVSRRVRSVKLNEIEDDWRLIEKQLSADRKQQSNLKPIKSVSFSNFLKSRSPSQSGKLMKKLMKCVKSSIYLTITKKNKQTKIQMFNLS